jgi:hypothetical protein
VGVIVRRSQGATPQQWELFDRQAVRDGYRTTSRWVRDVCARELSSLRYRVEVCNRDGVWVPLRSIRRALSENESLACLAVLKEHRIKARRVAVEGVLT